MKASIVIQKRTDLFGMFGFSSNVHSDRGSSVRRIFERGRGARKFRKFEINEDQSENFPAPNQVRFPAQN